MESVRERFEALEGEDREWVLERAAIMEFDGGLTRGEACRKALEGWERRFCSVMGRGS